jgi:multiple sugar transport system permease protein
MTEKRRKRRRKLNRNMGVYLNIAPFLLVFFAFFALPLVMIFTTAFTDYDGAGVPRFVGLGNFAALFGAVSAEALVNTLKLIFTTALAGFLAGGLLAWLLGMMPRFLRALFTFALLIPMFAFGGDGQYFWTGAFGLGLLAILGGMRNVPRERYEAAMTLGMRNRVQELVYITLPAIKPQLLFAGVMNTAAGFALAAPKLGVHEHSAVFELGMASAVCAVVFLPLLVVYSVLRVIVGRCGE